MGSIPHHFYSDDYPFELSGFSGEAPVVPETNPSGGGGGAMWPGDQDSFTIPMMDDINGVMLHHHLSPESSSIINPQLGVSDGVVPAFSDHYNVGGLHGMQNFGVAYHQEAFDFGEECCGLFVPEFKPLGFVASDNWVFFYMYFR